MSTGSVAPRALWRSAGGGPRPSSGTARACVARPASDTQSLNRGSSRYNHAARPASPSRASPRSALSASAILATHGGPHRIGDNAMTIAHAYRTLAVAILLGLPALPPARADEAPVPERIVDTMNQLFGKHAGFRANHAKGIVALGTFAPSGAGLALTSAALLRDGEVPVTARFSDATGVPAIPDGDPNANPHGMAVRFTLPDGSEMDIVANSLAFFPVATGEDFLALLQAAGASGPDAAKPTPIERFAADASGGRPSRRLSADAVELRARDLQRRQRLRLRGRGRHPPSVPLQDRACGRCRAPDRGGGQGQGAGLPGSRARPTAGARLRRGSACPPRWPRREIPPTMPPSHGPPTARRSISARSRSPGWRRTARHRRRSCCSCRPI